MEKVEIFTDGACRGNPGPGGYGSIIRTRDQENEISGSAKSTTNNIMELTAAVVALKQLKEPCEVTFDADDYNAASVLLPHCVTSQIKSGRIRVCK